MSEVTMLDLVENLIRRHEMEGRFNFARLSWRNWRKYLAPFFRELPPSRLTTVQQEDYRALRLREGVCNVTINRELQVLRRAYKVGSEQEPPLVNRVPRFLFTKENNARKHFIDMPTLERIRVEASKREPWVRAVIELAYTYGWRRGELAKLTVADVDLFDNVLRLPTSKNGDAREVPIIESVRPYLERLVTGRAPDERLIATIDQIAKAWRSVFDAAGAKDKRLHDLRRTSAKVKRAAGVPTSVIMEMQGWKTEAMFRRYAIVDRQDKLDAFKKQAVWEAARGGPAC